MRNEQGEPFDWGNVIGGILQIRSQSSRPDDAAVAIEYRGSWFYINDTDLGSKSTMALLSRLFALQAGKIEQIAPVLTLPVGQ